MIVNNICHTRRLALSRLLNMWALFFDSQAPVGCFWCACRRGCLTFACLGGGLGTSLQMAFIISRFGRVAHLRLGRLGRI